MRAISYRQIIFLSIMTMPIAGHFLLVSPIIVLAGRDAWISVLFTIPIGLFFAFMLYRIDRLADGACLIDMFRRLLGRFLGSIGLLLFIGYGMFMLIITLYAVIDFTELIYLRDYPKISIASCIQLVVVYGIIKGIEPIARASEPIALLLPFTGSAASVANMTFKDYSMLLPVLQDGIRPVWHGMVMTLAMIGEMMVFMMYAIQRKPLASRKMFVVLSGIVLFACLMFIGTISGALCIFGVASTTAKLYPSYDMLKLVNFGIINRFDIYGIFTLATGGVIRLALWQIAICRVVTKLVRSSKPVWIHSIIIFVVLITVLGMIPNNVQFEQTWIQHYYPLTAWISIGLPFILWLVSEWKKKSRHEQP